MQSEWDNLTENYPLPDLDVMQDPKWPYRMQETITLCGSRGLSNAWGLRIAEGRHLLTNSSYPIL